MPTPERRTPIPYKSALKWIVDNDDIEWLPDETPSITAYLVADIYRRTEEEITRDLCALAAKKRNVT